MTVLVNGKPYRYVVDAMYHNKIEQLIRAKNHRGALSLIQLHDKKPKESAVETLADEVIGLSEKWGKGHRELVDRLNDMDAFTDKPNSWKEIGTLSLKNVTRLGKMDKMSLIPTFDDDDVFGKRVTKKDSPTQAEFTKTMPYLFFLTTDFGTYLVNTEGYDYPRYAVKISGV